MPKLSLNLKIYQLFKSAFEDIQEFLKQDNWITPYMQSNPALNKFKSYSDVVKSIPIPDFRKSANISNETLLVPDPNSLSNLLDYFIINNLEPIKDKFIDVKEKLAGDNYVIADKFLDGLLEIIAAVDENYIVEKFKIEKKLRNIFCLSKSVRIEFIKADGYKKVITLPAGMFIPQALQTFSDEYSRYAPTCESGYFNTALEEFKKFCNVKYITNSDIYKKLDFWLSDKFKLDLNAKMNQKFEVVFTTKPEDILTMSTRSIWTSCQSLLDPDNKYKHKAVWSAVSPYIGIIYITNKQDYQSRGEEMISRSLVAYLESKDENEPPIIAVMKPYSNFNINIARELFHKALEESSPVKVVTITAPSHEADPKLENYYFPTEQESDEENPYFDTRLKFGPPKKK